MHGLSLVNAQLQGGGVGSRQDKQQGNWNNTTTNNAHVSQGDWQAGTIPQAAFNKMEIGEYNLIQKAFCMEGKYLKQTTHISKDTRLIRISESPMNIAHGSSEHLQCILKDCSSHVGAPISRENMQGRGRGK